MPRKARTIADVHRKIAGTASKGRGSRRRISDNGLDKREVTAAVCKYLCQGYSATETAELMKKNHGVEMSREKPYEYFAYAASHQWLRYKAPPEVTIRQHLRDRYTWLTDLEVVHTAVYDDVAYHGAEMLINLLKRHHQTGKKAVHVGFAGGYAMRKLAHVFADLLRQPTEGLPGTLVAHALSSGFDPHTPSTAPSAFFTWLLKDASMQIDTEFVGFEDPPIMRDSAIRARKNIGGVRESYTHAADLDIIVTSASCWDDPHSSLYRHLSRDTRLVQMLEKKADCHGDMLWQPLSANGWLEPLPPEIEALTVVKLSQLPSFIKDEGKDVLLIIGPCGGCNKPQTGILDTILGLDEHLINHLVVDSRTAAQAL